MTDLTEWLRPDRGEPAHGITLVDAAGFDRWRAAAPEAVRVLATAQRFMAKPDQILILPGVSAADWHVIAGVAQVDAPSRWALARAAEILPAGTYRLTGGTVGAAAFGWLMAQHCQDDWRTVGEAPAGPRVLLTTDAAGIAATTRLAAATMRVRAMVNTPPNLMGPQAIEDAARAIARAHGATVTVVRGDALATGYPLIHAVGAAAGRDHEARLIALEWGAPDAPRVAIVGKGVTFDSGGLDIKPAAGMRLMKKDMGGAAHALALAELVMAEALPIRLLCLVPAVENAISGGAMRPGDIIRSRAGIHVEIDNTDAEGRLILADALTHARDWGAGLVLDFATLTGAARVALGPDLPALFANDDALADALFTAGVAVEDPVWRLPLWPAYADMLASDIADVANSGGAGFAGAVTAALFLQKFIDPAVAWAHFDTFAWRPAAAPGRPKGGEALGLRAAHAVLVDRFAVRRDAPNATG